MDLLEVLKNQNEKKENYVYINNCDNINNKIAFEDNVKIVDVLEQNNFLCDGSKIYQIKDKNIEVNNTFSFYGIKNEDVIYVLPPPAPLPYIIYLYHEKTGNVHCVELNHADSIHHLQKHIEKHLKIKKEDQILIYNDKPLNSSKTLKEENLERESVVLIIDKKDIPHIQEEENIISDKM